MTSSSFFDNICSLPVTSDIFTQALHPKLPILTVGLASGHVQSYRLPDTNETEDVSSTPPSILSNGTTSNGLSSILSSRRRSSTASENGLGSIETLWKTRRHKGSCRCVTYSYDGALSYSAGTDGLVKCFESESGRVISKIAIPQDGAEDGDIDGPTLLHALSPQALILGTDSGKLYLHDLRQGGREVVGKPSQTWSPHGDEHVNALIPLPPSEASTSGFPKSWVSVGGTTLAVTDIRKGVIATSEDQEVELTSVAVVQGLKRGGTSVGEKILVGQSDGVMSLWERGVWGDLDERITIDKTGGPSIDSISEVPMSWVMSKGRNKLKMNEKMVVVGLEDGQVKFVRIGRNGVISEWNLRHDEIDGVAGIGFDAEGDRMVTSGGQLIKVWTEAKGKSTGMNGAAKRNRQDSDEDSDEDDSDDDKERDSDDSDSEQERNPGKRKKRKRNKGKDRSGGKALDFSGIL